MGDPSTILRITTESCTVPSKRDYSKAAQLGDRFTQTARFPRLASPRLGESPSVEPWAAHAVPVFRCGSA